MKPKSSWYFRVLAVLMPPSDQVGQVIQHGPFSYSQGVLPCNAEASTVSYLTGHGFHEIAVFVEPELPVLGLPAGLCLDSDWRGRESLPFHRNDKLAIVEIGPLELCGATVT